MPDPQTGTMIECSICGEPFLHEYEGERLEHWLRWWLPLCANCTEADWEIKVPGRLILRKERQP